MADWFRSPRELEDYLRVTHTRRVHFKYGRKRWMLDPLYDYDSDGEDVRNVCLFCRDDKRSETLSIKDLWKTKMLDGVHTFYALFSNIEADEEPLDPKYPDYLGTRQFYWKDWQVPFIQDAYELQDQIKAFHLNGRKMVRIFADMSVLTSFENGVTEYDGILHFLFDDESHLDLYFSDEAGLQIGMNSLPFEVYIEHPDYMDRTNRFRKLDHTEIVSWKVEPDESKISGHSCGMPEIPDDKCGIGSLTLNFSNGYQLGLSSDCDAGGILDGTNQKQRMYIR